MNRLAAFKQIAAAKGGKPGTVAANYYRIARKRGVALRPRRAAGASVGGTTRVSTSLTTALRVLESALRAQGEALAALQRDSQRFEKLRRLLTA
jgi:hypothetical protein